MAAAFPLQDIDDTFFHCSICLEQLKEPKLLPCLHRYCKECLRSIIQGRYDYVTECPECREDTQIQTHGIDGFKTDFYSIGLVEYEIRECLSCSKHLRVAAYCDLLCKDCHNVHVTNKTLKDHQNHTLSLEDIEAENIIIEKLASMRDAPRCHIHLKEISRLYCETCNNLPVCMACTYGDHKGHTIHEVKALAELKREHLTSQLKALGEIEKDRKPITPSQAKEKLMFNVNIEKEKVIKIHDQKDQEILTKIQDIEEKRQQLKQEKEDAEKKIFDQLQKDMENEIQAIEKKYEEIFEATKMEMYNSFEAGESSRKRN